MPLETKDILNLKIKTTDLDGEECTIGEYLQELLVTLWVEGECFSGKRPLGNSGWEVPIFIALVRAGLVKGKILEDEDGEWEDLTDCDDAGAYKLIKKVIREVFSNAQG